MVSSSSGGPPESRSAAAIKNGTIAGVLPVDEAFAINYPGYPSSTDRAIETLGGLPAIAKARSLESNSLELRFRPEDPYSHPAVSGPIRPCSSLLLKISKTKAAPDASASPSQLPPADQLSAEVVARVNHAYNFDGMVDYQYVIPVHAAEAARKKRRLAVEAELDSGDDSLVPDPEDVLMLLPKFFSPKIMPENLVLTPSVNLFSKIIQKGVVEHRWEMDIEPCLAIPFDIERIPINVNWEDKLQKDTEEWEWQMVVSKLFEERPIWPRWSLNERLIDDGIHVTGHQLKRLLLRTGYYFSTGPFGRFFIKKGYDPRKDPESRRYQKVDFRMPNELRTPADGNTDGKLKQTWKDICQFRVFPSKTFVCLQLFELVDDFIQQEIRNGPVDTTCTHWAGWFSRPQLQILRYQVCIRFLSLSTNKGAEALLTSKRESIEKLKKEEARKPEKEHQHANKEHEGEDEPNVEIEDEEEKEELNIHVSPPDADVEPEIEDEKEEEELSGYESPPEGEDGPSNGAIEDEEEEVEEEEEELNGFESPPMAGEEDTFTLDAGSYQAGDGIPNDYLQELLRGFPFSKDGKESQPKDGPPHADSSDGEYQIFEQDSDADDSS